MSDDKIIFTTDDGEKVAFTVIEEARLSGVNYLLVVDEDYDEEEAYILKEIRSEQGDSIYEIFDDEEQFPIILDYFNALLDDVDLEV